MRCNGTFGLVAVAQDTLNNDAVVKMVKGGLGESLIVNMIQGQPGNYSMKPDDMVKLKQQGVTDKEMNAMMAKASAGPAAAAAPTASVSSDSDVPANMDIGVYYKKMGKWEEMLPEVVNWKTGGVIKSLATAGVVKGDVNGHINGAQSRNSVASPVEVVIYAPEGTAITEYQLLHLHENKDAREFRTVTGGIMHVEGGATRDLIPFEGKKVAPRTYKVLLPSLGAGEYGFLPPGAIGSSNGSSIGKLYSFRLLGRRWFRCEGEGRSGSAAPLFYSLCPGSVFPARIPRSQDSQHHKGLQFFRPLFAGLQAAGWKRTGGG